jgi:small subunit ribosomal protein S20
LATQSAAKAHRQSLQRRLRNRVVRTSTKTIVKKAETAIAAGDPEVSREAVRTALGALDRAATKGVIHANAAARRKSRLVLKYNAAVAAIQTPPTKAEKPKRRQTKTAKSTKTTKTAKARRTKKAEK